MSTQKTKHQGRNFGYLLSIFINGAILYAIIVIPLWEYIPPLTDEFIQARSALGLSVGVTIFMYWTFLAFDPRWFRSLMQSIANIFSIYSIWIFREVFPLDVSESMAGWINIGLIFLMAIMILSTLIEFFASIRHFRKTISN